MEERQEEPFSDLDSVLSSTKYALVTKGRSKDATILSEAEIELKYSHEDNWDGGTSVWCLCIKIPYPRYIAYEDEDRRDLESFIDETIKPFLPEYGHWVQSKIKPQQFSDKGWRTKSESLKRKADSKFWISNHFRLFLSHLSTFKKETANLQKSLRKYGISAFVAHKDIEPTKEWQTEIENALHSMDALGAILTPEFNKSQWTDQEVGVAIGRNVLIIPICKGLNPYGLIGKYQALQGEDKHICEVSKEIFKIISNHPKTTEKIISILVDQVILANNVDDALKKLRLIINCKSLSKKHLEKIRDDSKENSIIINSIEFVGLLNLILDDYKMEHLKVSKSHNLELRDEIPF